MAQSYAASVEIHRLKKDGTLDEGAPKVCFKVKMTESAPLWVRFWAKHFAASFLFCTFFLLSSFLAFLFASQFFRLSTCSFSGYSFSNIANLVF